MPEPNEQQAVFVREYVSNGGNGSEAARLAGYSEKSAGKYAYELLQKPHVLFAVHAEQARVIGSEAATLAVGVIVGILKDEDAKSSVRLDAAKAALALAGHVAPKAPEPVDDPSDYPMSEWSAAELEDFIRRGKAAIEAAEKDDETGDDSESVH